MKKIALIANFNGPKTGGLKTVMNEVSKQYKLMGIDCIQIIPGSRDSIEVTDFVKIHTIKSLGIPFSGGYRIILNLRKVKKILENFDPEILEIHDRFSLISLAKWANARDITTVAFAHERLLEVFKVFFGNNIISKRIVSLLNNRLASNVEHIIATTKFASEEFSQLAPEKIKLIPLGVDHNIFHPLKRTIKFDSQLIRLVLCSRLSKEKNPQLVFDLVKKINSNKTRVNLTIIGSGVLRKKLQKQNKDFSVKFLEYVSDKHQIANIIANADVLLAPGPNETFCLAALEAQACGTPVIGSNKSALKEIIDENTGRVVDNKLDNWEKAIFELSGKDEIRKKSFENSLKYSWKFCSEKLVNLYLETKKEKVSV
ncbi:MAG: hypothetical protein RLZZ37_1213 [Actinomycetota bacterium]|jgi:alpha-1,6-mannosyltransferase